MNKEIRTRYSFVEIIPQKPSINCQTRHAHNEGSKNSKDAKHHEVPLQIKEQTHRPTGSDPHRDNRIEISIVDASAGRDVSSA